MAHAWNACWVNALGGSNPPFSAFGPGPLDRGLFASWSSRLVVPGLQAAAFHAAAGPPLARPAASPDAPVGAAVGVQPARSVRPGPRQDGRLRAWPSWPASPAAEVVPAVRSAAPASPGIWAQGWPPPPRTAPGSRAGEPGGAGDRG